MPSDTVPSLVSLHATHIFCVQCGLKCNDYDALGRHVMMEHTPAQRPTRPPRVEHKKLFHCGMCPKAFARKERLTGHVAVAHSSANPYKCQECGKVYARRDSLQNHQYVHTEEVDRVFGEACVSLTVNLDVGKAVQMCEMPRCLCTSGSPGGSYATAHWQKAVSMWVGTTSHGLQVTLIDSLPSCLAIARRILQERTA